MRRRCVAPPIHIKNHSKLFLKIFRRLAFLAFPPSQSLAHGDGPKSSFPRYQTQTSVPETKSRRVFLIAVLRDVVYPARVFRPSLIFRLDRSREREETLSARETSDGASSPFTTTTVRPLTRSLVRLCISARLARIGPVAVRFQSSFKGNRNAETVSVV